METKSPDGGHSGGLKQSLGNLILFLYKELFLFHVINMAAGHLSENRLLWNCTHFRHPIDGQFLHSSVFKSEDSSNLEFRALALPHRLDATVSLETNLSFVFTSFNPLQTVPIGLRKKNMF